VRRDAVAARHAEATEEPSQTIDTGFELAKRQDLFGVADAFTLRPAKRRPPQ